MGILSAIEKWQERRIQADALRILNPYVFMPQRGEVLWMRWEIIPQTEAAGIFPKHDGSPVFMNEKECAVVNGGKLPQFWGEVECAWRDESQKRAFYAKYPDRFEEKQQSKDYPSEKQVEEVWDAYKTGGAGAIAEVLRKRREEREAAKRDLTHEELMELVRQSSTRELTDEEINILTSRLCWRDEATRAQWYREQGIDSPEFTARKDLMKHKTDRYPTREDLAEVLELHKQFGKEGIRLFLRKQAEKREAERQKE